jgi:hypothetical protein
VANGLRTDHPIPDLPFVDDGHIPVDEPKAIEAIGRREGGRTWGREDRSRHGGWVAFTTEERRHDLAWVVRWHPEHGRSVVLYRDEDASSVHSILMWEEPAALLFRAGGYWWDGAIWYRPSQIWDAAAEEFYRRPVPAAVTVTAGDLLQNGGDASRAQLLSIDEVDFEADPPANWRDHLALWASRRDDRGLADNVVTLAAPELTGDQLVGVTEMARIAGIAASTLRAYISRDQSDVPAPQANVQGRNAWARPVAEEWAEQRHRSAEGLTDAVSADRDGNSLPVGTVEVWTRFSRIFYSHLWERPGWRKRWALRWRTEAAVRAVAEELSWDVAASLTDLIPTYRLAITIRHAFLHEFATGKHLQPGITDPDQASYQFAGVGHDVAKMLDWLVRHHPAAAGSCIQQIIGEAERELDIPRQVAERSITTALTLDGTLDRHAREDFLQRVLAPQANGTS